MTPKNLSPTAMGLAFRQRLLAVLALAAGGLIFAVSLVFHAKITTRRVVMPISPVNPLAITVIVDGPSSHPGLIGFLATVHPRDDRLTVIPIPGRIRLRLPNGTGGYLRVPAWQGVSMASPQIVADAIDRSTGFTATRYFFMPVSGLKTVLSVLIKDTKTWPAEDSIAHSLRVLGYPGGRGHPVQELAFLNQLMTTLPQLTPLEASSLVGVATASSTNLTPYQLFKLGNYVRGDRLALSRLSSLQAKSRRPHQYVSHQHLRRRHG